MKDKFFKRSLYVTGLLMTLFHLVVLNFFPLSADKFRPIHLLFVLVMVFMLYSGKKKGSDTTKSSIDILSLAFVILSIVTMIYSIMELENILERGGIWTTNTDLIMGTLTVICVLEGTRRSNGSALPLIAIVFLLYGFWGQNIPGMLGHTGYSLKRMITTIYTYDGIFGTALDTAASFVAMFIIFAAFLEKTGVGESFLDLAKAVAGRSRGALAKVAVIACALFGTISGSAVACVAATGAIIIPLMIKMDYDKTFSGAAVSSAAIGGQIMPPVMAAGAFLMAEFLGVKYIEVMRAAVIPAVMYFFTIWISIDCMAAKMGLTGLKKEDLPRLKIVLKQDWILFFPLVLLIVMLVVFRYSAIKCAFYSMVASVIVCAFDKERRMNLKTICDTMVSAAKGIASTACACACAGIVIGCINLTGLGLKISTVIINFSEGRVIYALILSMVTAVIFGMGLPTTVSYLLCVSVLSPVLINMGIAAMAAHMFIFYFACLSGITPPVALAAYTAAGIAGTDPIKTAVEGSKLAIVAFFVPYMFVYNNAFLMDGSIPQILWAVVVGITSCYAIAACAQGFLLVNLNVFWRSAFGVCAVLLFIQHKVMDIAGLVVFATLFIILYRKFIKKQKTEAQVTA